MKRKIFKFVEKTVCHLSTWIEPDSYSNLNFAHKEKLYSKNKGSVIWNGSACGIDLNKFDCSRFVFIEKKSEKSLISTKKNSFLVCKEELQEIKE